MVEETRLTKNTHCSELHTRSDVGYMSFTEEHTGVSGGLTVLCIDMDMYYTFSQYAMHSRRHFLHDFVDRPFT